MEEKIQNDYLSVQGDKDILKIITGESLIFSDIIEKINEYGLSQERVFLITNKAIYNLEKKKMKRKIEISYLKGITVSKETDEFIIHGNDHEYDYHFNSSKKKKIVMCLGNAFSQLMKKSLPVAVINEKSLKSFATSKSDKKKDDKFSRMPQETIPYENYINDKKEQKSNAGKSGTIFSKNSKFKTVEFDDFNILKVLGVGGYGKVYLVEFIPTKEIYAMKAIKKHILIEDGMLEYTLNEKKILSENNHPFLVNLIFCFQTVERIYFVMPVLRGGELFQHLKNVRVFNEEKTKFYTSQLAIALQYLHDANIIYRDLKPENILIDEEGYLKITDFGLAKVLQDNEKASTFAGTPEYLAPEVISQETGYDKNADWWSFGVLMYEMLYGQPPFYDKNVSKMFENVKHGKLTFSTRVKTSPEAQDILTKLLDKNPKKRLGAVNGLKDIQNHPFFKTLDFDLIFKRKIKAPFKPVVKSKLDTGNFDSEFTNEAVDETEIETSKIAMVLQNQEIFKEFNK